MTPTKEALDALTEWQISRATGDPDLEHEKATLMVKAVKQALTANTSDALVNELIDLLHIMWDGYENGDPCYENLDGEQGGFMGNAFQICDDKETRICEILNHHRPVKPKPEQPPC